MTQMYLSPGQLKLSQEELNALIAVRDMLATVPVTREVVDFNSTEDAEVWNRQTRTINVLDSFGGFDMSSTCISPDRDPNVLFERSFSCGTVGCIAGWMGVYMWDTPPVIGEKKIVNHELASKISEFVRSFDQDRGHDAGSEWQRNALNKLFYPKHDDGEQTIRSWDKITAAEAVLAINNFLVTGTPSWQDVLGETMRLEAVEA